MQTNKKYSHRSIIWPPGECKQWKYIRNLCRAKQSNITEGAVEWSNDCRRLRCKLKTKQYRRLQTDGIQWRKFVRDKINKNNNLIQLTSTQITWYGLKLTGERWRKISYRLYANSRQNRPNIQTITLDSYEWMTNSPYSEKAAGDTKFTNYVAIKYHIQEKVSRLRPCTMGVLK